MADETAKVVTTAPEKMLLIPASQAQVILNYLAKQPFGEVYNLVPMLMNLKEVPAPSPLGGTLPPNPHLTAEEVARLSALNDGMMPTGLPATED